MRVNIIWSKYKFKSLHVVTTEAILCMHVNMSCVSYLLMDNRIKAANYRIFELHSMYT